MIPIWPNEAAAVEVARVAATPRLLVALDFDGTLAPLGDDPMSVRATPPSAAAVAALASLPDTVVAFVSGRSLSDLRIIAEHTDDSPVVLAGSHGVQFWVPGEGELLEEADPAAEQLRVDLTSEAERIAEPLAGVWIEVKALGFAVHTRLSNDADSALAHEQIDALVSERAPGWRRRTGQDILEFSSRDEGKDAGVRALRERFGSTAVVFAGDDKTDEDALGDLEPGDLGIRVGDAPTAATIRAADIPAVAELLANLADLRSRHLSA